MIKEDFSKQLSNLLEERGLSQTDLSKLTGIKESIIHDWIAEKYLPHIDERVRIAKILNVGIERFYKEDDCMPWTGREYFKAKYQELKELATSIVDKIEDDGIALSKGNVNTLLELLRLEIMYRYRM